MRIIGRRAILLPVGLKLPVSARPPGRSVAVYGYVAAQAAQVQVRGRVAVRFPGVRRDAPAPVTVRTWPVRVVWAQPGVAEFNRRRGFVRLPRVRREAPIVAVVAAVGEEVVELRLFSPSGVEFGRVSDFNWLGCSVRVNEPGLMEAELRGGHAALSQLVHRSLVEVWRKDPPNGVGWYRHFSGVYLDQDRTLFQVPTLTLRAAGDVWLLSTRVVNYHAGYTGRAKFINQKGETIAKSLVTYNVTASATTANGRKRAGTNWPGTVITVETDQLRGNTLDWYCMGDNLLETLQALALVGGGDFDLVKVGSSSWEFRWYPGQLGVDRSGSVVFSTGRDNMGDARYRFDRMKAGTVAAVWGQGEGSARDYVTRTGTDFEAENDIEFFVNATDVELGNMAGLNASGDQSLQAQRAREMFGFRALQTKSTLFQAHYGLGDLVTVVNPFTGASAVQKVQAVHLALERGKPVEIEPELGTP